MVKSVSKTAVHAHILVSGRVQGVGYRAFAARAALNHGLVGGVRNLDDGRVELEVEGQPLAIDALLRDLRDGPPAARVTHVETRWREATGRFSSFKIWY
ncbi:MAG: acylphosphatase [Nitrospira sp.]|jgi:acylphosphatase|uniref:acylphosphatase n=1 Tax=Candidatus Nitrospira inopinata TaxID=1715989 RepID=A0A0S4KYE5_9BACT|nr:acylphosphatase [Candidatus Nitrospira inopinata]MCP9470787.1 acylphosphatase [Nitrospira sp.]CUQ68190.1 Acylphosphatase [Candidatus Nitrospira inopinata]